MSDRRWRVSPANPYVGQDEDFEREMAQADDVPGTVPAAGAPDATTVAPADATRVASADATRVAGADATRVANADATHVVASDATRISSADRTRASAAPGTHRVDPTKVRPMAQGDTAVQGTPRIVSAATGAEVPSPGGTTPHDIDGTVQRPGIDPSRPPVTDQRLLDAANAARAALDARQGGPDDAYFGGAAAPSITDHVPDPVRRAWSRGVSAPLSPRRQRFWRWFRTLPILAMVVMGVLAVALSWMPTSALRRLFYPVRYSEAITASASRHGVDADLVCAVIRTESNWQPEATSQAGAVGLMQLLPSTAQDLAERGYVNGARFPASDLTDPAVNIEYGTAYLAHLIDATGSVDEAICAYNAGPGKVADWRDVAQEVAGGDISAVIDYPETRAYLAKVTSALDEYRTLYPDGLVDD